MKTKIQLKPREFKLMHLTEGLSGCRGNLSEKRANDIYRGIRTLLNKYYWIDKPVDSPLTFMNLYSLLEGESLINLIESSKDADATKKKSFETVWYLSQSLNYPIDKSEIYHEKFKCYNRKTKEHGRTIPVIMSDEFYDSCKQNVIQSVNMLATSQLTVDSPLSLVIRYRDTLLKILVVELPTRGCADYYLLRNKDDGRNSFYNDGKIYYRSLENNGLLAVVDIPVQYVTLFNSYHKVASGISDYFFFGERNKAQIDSQNFSGYVTKKLGVNLQAFSHKWGEIIESKKGTPEYYILKSIYEKNK